MKWTGWNSKRVFGIKDFNKAEGVVDVIHLDCCDGAVESFYRFGPDRER
jgi:hypothetical protein